MCPATAVATSSAAAVCRRAAAATAADGCAAATTAAGAFATAATAADGCVLLPCVLQASQQRAPQQRQRPSSRRRHHSSSGGSGGSGCSSTWVNAALHAGCNMGAVAGGGGGLPTRSQSTSSPASATASATASVAAKLLPGGGLDGPRPQSCSTATANGGQQVVISPSSCTHATATATTTSPTACPSPPHGLQQPQPQPRSSTASPFPAPCLQQQPQQQMHCSTSEALLVCLEHACRPPAGGVHSRAWAISLLPDVACLLSNGRPSVLLVLSGLKGVLDDAVRGEGGMVQWGRGPGGGAASLRHGRKYMHVGLSGEGGGAVVLGWHLFFQILFNRMHACTHTCPKQLLVLLSCGPLMTIGNAAAQTTNPICCTSRLRSAKSV